MKPALLLIDLQNDFLAQAELSPSASRVVRQAALLLEGCRRLGVPVMHGRTTVRRGDDRRMTHWKIENRWLCVEDSAGHDAPERLRPRPGEVVADKCGFSVFEDDKLDAALAGLGCDTLILAGVHLHACVRTAATEAYRRGWRVVIAEDGVASNDPLHAAVTRRYLAERAVDFRTVAAILQMLGSGVDSGLNDRGTIYAHRSPEDLRRELFRVEETVTDDVRDSVAAAHRAWDEWRETSMADRRELLRAVAGAIERESKAITQMLVEHIGKPVAYADQEVKLGVEFIRRAAEYGAEVEEEPAVKPASCRRVPLGVIAAITPSNNPVAVPLGKLAAGVVYGNAVVWKPAPAAAAIADRIRRFWLAAGCPGDLVRIVHGGAETARRLVSDPRVDAATITGSIDAGYAIQEICSRRHIPMQGELGGNNASIVWLDADHGSAAEAIAKAAFGFAGQRCTANRRVVVDGRCGDVLLDRLIEATAVLRWGDPRDATTEIGPVISAAKREELTGVVEDSAKSGCAVHVPHRSRGGEVEPPEHGAYFPPTIVCCDDPKNPIVQEESFGPILVVQRARDFDHAIELVNGVPHGLAASLFSGSEQLCERFLAGVKAGVLKINQATAGVDAGLPFGGWKASGIGPPEHGVGDREFYTRSQAVYREPSQAPRGEPSGTRAKQV